MIKKRTCGQCSSDSGLTDSIFPVRCKTGRVTIISMPLCNPCRGQARRIIARAVATGRLAV